MQDLLQSLGTTSDATKRTLFVQHLPGRLLLLLLLLLLLRQVFGYVLGILLYILCSS